MIVTINIITIILIILEIQTGFLEKSEEKGLCYQALFLVIRGGGEIVTVIFLVLGIIITVKVQS